MKHLWITFLFWTATATAQINIVVPFPPGSTSDLLPRLIAAESKTAIVIENIAGANGIIGAQRVAGNTQPGTRLLLATTGVLSINPWIYEKLPYNLNSFDPVVNLAASPNVLVVNSDYPVSTVKEIVELAKTTSLTYASAGVGSTSHLCGELINKSAGISLRHIPFKGPAPAKQALYAGEVTLMCDNFSNVIQDSKLKIIAIADTKRHPLIPAVPTFSELGYKNVVVGIWYGLVAAQGTSTRVIDQLNRDIVTALNQPDMQERLKNLGLTTIADSPEHFKHFLIDDQRRWKKIVNSVDIKK